MYRGSIPEKRQRHSLGAYTYCPVVYNPYVSTLYYFDGANYYTIPQSGVPTPCKPCKDGEKGDKGDKGDPGPMIVEYGVYATSKDEFKLSPPVNNTPVITKVPLSCVLYGVDTPLDLSDNTLTCNRGGDFMVDYTMMVTGGAAGQSIQSAMGTIMPGEGVIPIRGSHSYQYKESPSSVLHLKQSFMVSLVPTQSLVPIITYSSPKDSDPSPSLISEAPSLIDTSPISNIRGCTIRVVRITTTQQQP